MAYETGRALPGIIFGALSEGTFGAASGARSIARSEARDLGRAAARDIEFAPTMPGAASSIEGPALRPITASGACFVAGTLVHTPNGPVPIETLTVGDQVVSQPEMQGEIAYRRINETFRFDDKPVLEVTYIDKAGRKETLTATGNHPFWVKGEGWTAAELLDVGDVLELHDRSEATLVAVIDTGRTETVHNFEVDGFHTYYVGIAGVWVHNTNCRMEIHWGAQNKHIPGTNNYIMGRSILTADPNKLLGYAGSGDAISGIRGLPGFKERVDFGFVIGDHKSWNGSYLPTNRGIIVYSTKGIHIYPSDP